MTSYLLLKWSNLISPGILKMSPNVKLIEIFLMSKIKMGLCRKSLPSLTR